MSSPRDEIIERLRRVPDRLARLIENKSGERLRQAGAGGSWGAVEHLAYLSDFEEVTLDRVKQIITGQQPEIELFDTDVRAIEMDYHGQDPLKTLERFREDRQELLQLLTPLPDEAWGLTANHSDLGLITLAELIQRLDEHNQSHLQSVKEELL